MREKRRYILVEGAEDIGEWIKEHIGYIGIGEGDVKVEGNIVRVKLSYLPKLLGVIALHPTARIARVAGTLKALKKASQKEQE